MVEPHGNLFVKSGTDFRNMTKIKVEFPEVPHPAGTAPAAARPKLSWEEVLITLDVPEDKAVAKARARALTLHARLLPPRPPAAASCAHRLDASSAASPEPLVQCPSKL